MSESTLHRSKRVVIWAVGVLASLVLLLVTATWVVNRPFLQTRIRQAVEDRTGDALRFDHISVALLPRPHITVVQAAFLGKVKGLIPSSVVYPEILPLFTGKVRIQKVVLHDPELNVTVSEEQVEEAPQDAKSAFSETRNELESVINSIRSAAPHLTGEVRNGNISVIRGNKVISRLSRINGKASLLSTGFNVEATAETLRWGHISAAGALSVGKNSIAVRNFSIAGGHSSLTNLSAGFGWRTTPYLHIESGRGIIVLHDVFERRDLIAALSPELKNVKSLAGTVKIAAVNFRGPLWHPQQWKMQTTGTIEDVVIDLASIPRPLRFSKGDFEATAKTVSLTNMQGQIIDSSVSASLSIDGFSGTISSAEASLDGTIGRETVLWFSKVFKIPPRFIVRAPLSFSGVHVGWKRGSTIFLAGSVAAKRGPVITIEGTKKNDDLLINRLIIKDLGGQAQLTAAFKRRVLDFTFRGSLNEITISRLFEHASLSHGWLRGTMQGKIFLDKPGQSTAQGIIEAGDLTLDIGNQPITIKHAALHATSRILTVNTSAFIWAGMPFDLSGTIIAASETLHLDMDLSADRISFETLQQSIANTQPGAAGTNTGSKLPFGGDIRFRAKQFLLGRYSVSPFVGVISLTPGKPLVTVSTAEICGISVPGTVDRDGEEVRFSFQPKASGQALGPALICLFGADRRITGTYSLNGEIAANGKSGELLQALRGHVEFTAKDGEITQAPILARIFGLLNVTELLRGKLPDLGRQGFKYSSVKIKGNIKNGKLTVPHAMLEGKTVNMAAEGQIDVAGETVNITVLVAPFKTLEYILSKIPLLRNILANRLVTVPVRVSGDISNPDVTPLDPKAIGQNLLDIMKGILELPFQVLHPHSEQDSD